MHVLRAVGLGQPLPKEPHTLRAGGASCPFPPCVWARAEQGDRQTTPCPNHTAA